MYNIRTILARQGIFFMLTMLGLVALNVIWLIPTLRNTRASASVFALTIAERVQSEINGSLQNALNEARGVAGEIAEEPERINSTFRYLLLRNPIFINMALVDRGGKELVRVDASGVLPPEKLIDQSRNTSFYLALQNRTAFTAPVISPNGEVHVTLVVPVPTKGEFINRVIIAELDVQNLISIIRSLKIGEGHVYVLDRDGVEILNPDVGKILRRDNYGSRPIVKRVFVDGVVADGLAQEDRYVNENGEDTFTVGMLVPVVKWGVFVEQPRSQALVGERQAITLAVGTFILAIIIFFVIARSTVRLQKLTDEQKRLLVELDKANANFANLNHTLEQKVSDQTIEIRKSYEIEKKARIELEELDKAKDQFILTTQHHLRTPLTIVKGYLQSVLGKQPRTIDETTTTYLIKAEEATERIATLVNEFLDISQMEVGKSILNKEPTNIKGLITTIVQELEPEIQKKGARVTTKMEDGDVLNIDSHKIKEALTNLIDNAVKYNKSHGTVVITGQKTTHPIERDQQIYRLSIEDTGIGIPGEELPKLFTQYFQRGREAEKLYTTGRGIGLAITKNIIQAHGGRIYAESEGRGKGARFVVEVPIG